MVVSEDFFIALDAMGGDKAPDIVVDGAAMALKKYKGIKFLLYGDEEALSPLLEKHPELTKASEIVHTKEAISADEKPSNALRKGKNSSMRLAIEAVKSGKAAGVVSAGNTGALMAMSKIVLRMLPNVSRPAIASIIPNQNNDILMMDLGANVECSARELCDFAIMGDAYARSILHRDKPKIALLNIGSEEMKGNEEIREAAAELKEIDFINFIGFAEGNDIMCGDVDVIVTDGFTGNVALKTMEGTASFLVGELKNTFAMSIRSKIGYLISKRALDMMRKKVDPRRYNGAMFLGLNGVVVKSHGGTDELGFFYAIGEAYELISNRVNEKIVQELVDSEGGESGEGKRTLNHDMKIAEYETENIHANSS